MVERDWNHRLAAHELTHAGLLALHALRDGPLTQRELAAASRVEEQTMSRVLERLERNGHVTRARDTADRRRLVIRRTSTGGELSDDLTRAGYADQLVAERVADPSSFRAELVRLVEASAPGGVADTPVAVDFEPDPRSSATQTPAPQAPASQSFDGGVP